LFPEEIDVIECKVLTVGWTFLSDVLAVQRH
jgi:hypothetical protein